MDQARRGRVAEVGKAQVEEVDDDQELRQPVMAADPQVNEAKEQQVVGYKVAADVGCGIDMIGVGDIERVGVE